MFYLALQTKQKFQIHIAIFFLMPHLFCSLIFYFRIENKYRDEVKTNNSYFELISGGSFSMDLLREMIFARNFEKFSYLSHPKIHNPETNDFYNKLMKIDQNEGLKLRYIFEEYLLSLIVNFI